MTAGNSQAERVRNLSRRMTARQRAVGLAEQHGVSLRTAQRWINAGVDPAELLTRDGSDGKRYHFQPKQHAERNPVRCLLHSITRKLDALDMAADECGITPEDAAQLNKIGCRLFDTAEAWRTAFDGSTGKGGKE